MHTLDLSSESAELLPQREALGGWGGGLIGDINTVTAVNLAIAVNVGGFGSDATAVANQWVGANQF
ncbi:hypothetical protein MOQ72_16125 [Saccharopolyspora sp. K220]|uniref:hypothetical protein n=1 Tax=Saccharopolyspora soli TaxID=2926618 RepID=UPI001F58DD00|nr:hypothetical protein [Saccharopolyspora soli]MCI2418972.1 hypothetical protein [Saccharopolyspora soli]